MMRAALSNRTLATLPAAVAVPAYDRATITRRASCISASAHSTAPTRPSMSTIAWPAGETGWGIVGASLRSADTRDALGPQDGLYTLAVRSSGGEKTARRRLDRVAAGGAGEPRGVAGQRCTDPAIRIVTLTITEKAYLRNAAGGLDAAHPDIVARSRQSGQAEDRAWLPRRGAGAPARRRDRRPSRCFAATTCRPTARRCAG